VAQTTTRTELLAASKALEALDVDTAKATLDRVGARAPLEYAAHVQLWEQRGITAAYVDDVATAKTSFGMLLALDPGHYLSYTLSPKATFVFEDVRKQPTPTTPTLDINWPRNGKVGDAVPVDIEVVADPRRLLTGATFFVRARGEATWRATDIAFAGGAGTVRVIVPPIDGDKPSTLELYVRGHDAKRNEVLAWADAAHPREIALRYEPPTPWYRRWWAYTIGASILAVGTGAIVYAVTFAPPDEIGGTASAP
jgi:hypothetical protein